MLSAAELPLRNSPPNAVGVTAWRQANLHYITHYQQVGQQLVPVVVNEHRTAGWASVYTDYSV